MFNYDIDVQCRFLWIEVYAAVIASEKESAETAVMQANEAVTRYRQAWGPNPQEGGQDGPSR